MQNLTIVPQLVRPLEIVPGMIGTYTAVALIRICAN